MIGTSLAFFRGQKGLFLENSEKVCKGGSRGLLAPGSKKLAKESMMTSFQVFSGFRLVFDSLSSLFGPGPRCPGTPFQTIVRVF